MHFVGQPPADAMPRADGSTSNRRQGARPRRNPSQENRSNVLVVDLGNPAALASCVEFVGKIGDDLRAQSFEWARSTRIPAGRAPAWRATIQPKSAGSAGAGFVRRVLRRSDKSVSEVRNADTRSACCEAVSRRNMMATCRLVRASTGANAPVLAR